MVVAPTALAHVALAGLALPYIQSPAPSVGSQVSITPVLGNPMPSGLQTPGTHEVQTNMQAKHLCI